MQGEALHPCSLCLHQGEGMFSILQEENNMVEMLPTFLHPLPFLLEDTYLTCLVMWEREMASGAHFLQFPMGVCECAECLHLLQVTVR